MGGKAKNATFISGNEAGKISKEVARVEKRRIVKSTLCNERSSRSHCMIILDVPSVGGRLMLVDMAGSENIEQAGQTGFEAKMQTAKINQGNIALKRVVESIANGDPYVPFRDSKLTMLLQDSFEDDKSKILMILCASPDPKEMHKTISTLEYGAKAKCIVRSTHTPNAKDKEHSSYTVLGSRMAAMDQFILKLQMENKLKEKERDEAHKELLRKEKEVAELRAKLELVEEKRLVSKDEEISSKVDERTQILKAELQKKLYECQQMENEFDELGRRMEEKILQQQVEVEMLRRRLEEIETELCHSTEKEYHGVANDTVGSSFIQRLSEIYPEGEQGMVKSMDLDMGEEQPVLGVKEVRNHDVRKPGKIRDISSMNSHGWAIEGDDIAREKIAKRVGLSTVFEGEEEENAEEEVKKEVVEEKVLSFGDKTDGFSVINMSHPLNLVQTPTSCVRNMGEKNCSRKRSENAKDAASARRTRIQNIFMLCGNHRELGEHVRFPTPSKKRSEAGGTRSPPMVLSDESATKPNLKELSPLQTVPQPEHRSYASFLAEGTARNNSTENPNSALLGPFSSLNIADEQKLTDSQLSKKCSSFEKPLELKENNIPKDEDGLLEVYVKWEASKENPGKFITKLKVLKNSSLEDLRKLIETHLSKSNNKQEFTFLMLGDPTGAPVLNEEEATIQASKLPICNSHISSHLACLRPIKKAIQRPNHLPFSSLENKLSVASNNLSMIDQGESFSPRTGKKFSSTFVKGMQI